MDAKTVIIQAHCVDCFSASFKDANNVRIGKEYSGYVPAFLGDNGDDVNLKIDLETGQILNWKKPTEEEIKELIG